MAQIFFNVDDREVKSLLKKLKRRVLNRQPAMRDISIFMKKEVLENFKEEGRPTHWKPLSPQYAKYKDETRGAGKPILEFDGKLKQSINARSTDDNAIVRTGVKYGVYQQTGTGSGLPARPFMPDKKNRDMPPFDVRGLQKIVDILSGYLEL